MEDGFDETPHTLIVHEVGKPYGPLSTNEFDDCDVIHDGCRSEVMDAMDQPYVVHTCAVGRVQNEGSLRYALEYSGTPIETPGTYLIGAWWTAFRPSRFGEWPGDADMSVALWDDSDETPATLPPDTGGGFVTSPRGVSSPQSSQAPKSKPAEGYSSI